MLSARTIHLNADAHLYSHKTPARGTRNRSENAYNQGAMTIHNGKAKASTIRTPFQPKTLQPQRLKEVSGSTKASIILVTHPTRPLADKTPFANRILNIYDTPAPEQKLTKLSTKLLEPHGATPENGSTRLSSTRRHSRLPTSANKDFRTPTNQGNYWDVVEENIAAPDTEMEDQLANEVVDDYGDIEYMPPNTLNLPYQPPFEFELPDYKVVGKEVLRSVYCYPYEEAPPPTYEFHIGDNEFMKWDSLSLASLDSDDESSRPKAKRTETASTRSSRPVSTQAFGRTTSRSTTSASMRPTTSALSISRVKPITQPRSNTTRTTSATTARKYNPTPITAKPQPAQKPILKPSITRPPPATAQSTGRISTTRPPAPKSRPATSAAPTRPCATSSSASVRTPLMTPAGRRPVPPKSTSTVIMIPKKQMSAVSRPPPPPLTTARSTAAVPSVRRSMATTASSKKPGVNVAVSKTTLSRGPRSTVATKAKLAPLTSGKSQTSEAGQ